MGFPPPHFLFFSWFCILLLSLSARNENLCGEDKESRINNQEPFRPLAPDEKCVMMEEVCATQFLAPAIHLPAIYGAWFVLRVKKLFTVAESVLMEH